VFFHHIVSCCGQKHYLPRRNAFNTTKAEAVALAVEILVLLLLIAPPWFL
jgi:hypothetical protein